MGLRSYALNLMAGLRRVPGLEATLVPVEYGSGGHWLHRVPGLPSGIAGTLCAQQEIRERLRAAGPADAVLWGTWAAKAVPQLVAARPAFFVMDMTPQQMTRMGEAYGYTQARASRFGAWKQRATRRIYACARGFLPWSDWVAQSLICDWAIPPDAIEVVSPGVDTTRFTPCPRTPRRERVHILFVGGDFVRKGGPILLDWAAKQRGRVDLTVVTRDDVANAPGNVRVLHGIGPNSEELIRLYQDTDIFALPTRGDCYSMVALEAMSCGVPVVITGLGGIPDIVDPGVTGFLTPLNDDGAFLTQLETLVANPSLRVAFSLASRQRALERFDAAACAAHAAQRILQG